MNKRAVVTAVLITDISKFNWKTTTTTPPTKSSLCLTCTLSKIPLTPDVHWPLLTLMPDSRTFHISLNFGTEGSVIQSATATKDQDTPACTVTLGKKRRASTKAKSLQPPGD